MRHSNRVTAALIAAFFACSVSALAQGISPVAGGGGGGGTGTVTQINTACAVSGGPITTTGTISGAAVIRAATGTTDTILAADCGKVVTESNAAPVAITLPQATGSFAAPFFYTQVCLGAGTCTITPTTSTINGAATLVLTTGQSADIASDGTNWIAALGKGGATTDASLLTSGTLAAARLPALTGDCTAAVGTGATNCDYPNPGLTAGQWYVPANLQAVQTGQAALINTIACFWGVIPQKATVSQLGVRITTAGTTNMQLAVYGNTSGRPGTLLSNTGNIVTTATGAVSASLGANKQLGPGGSDAGRNVWFCVNVGDGTTVFQSVGTSSLVGASAFGDTTLGNILQSAANAVTHLYCQGAGCNGGSSTFGTWPASLAGSTWTRGGAPNSGIAMPVIAYNPVSVP